MHKAISETTKLEAAQWLLELRETPNNPKTQQEWQSWLNASPEHHLAWQRIEKFSGQLSHISPELARSALSTPNKHPRRVFITSAAISLFAGPTLWYGHQHSSVQGIFADYRTRFGETQLVTLKDGTQLTLNSDSIVNIYYDAMTTVRLIKGDIFVVTSSNAVKAPLLIDLGYATAQPLGTRFLVSNQKNKKANISVYEGAVRLQPAEHNASPLRLNEGDAGVVSQHSAKYLGASKKRDYAWINGMLITKDTPLPEFLQQLSRHFPGHYQVKGEAHSVQVSGSFRLDNRDNILNVLQAAYALKLTKTRRWLVSEMITFEK